MDGYLPRARATPGGQCFVFADGQRLSKPKLNSLLKVLVREIGVPSENYSTHSFRMGAATTAAAAVESRVCTHGVTYNLQTIHRVVDASMFATERSCSFGVRM